MFRNVEDGSTNQMSLAPQVFREVLREYRSNSSANVDAVVDAIERLPDKLLFESPWVSRRNLTLDENIRISALEVELECNNPLSVHERAAVTAELTEGYRKLFEAGIIETNNCIRLAGAPLTAGFWKSFVEVERSKRWTWDDDSFVDCLRELINFKVGKACAALVQNLTVIGKEAVLALQSLRDGKTPPEFDEGMGEMIVSALIARDSTVTHVADLTFQIESPAGKQTHQCRFFEKVSDKLREDQFQEWFDNHRALLAGNEISIVITEFNRWELPSPVELHRLGRISAYPIPDLFGPPEFDQALSKFEEGDIHGCMEMFARMLGDIESFEIRNNLAFCQILTGNVAAGLENATKAVAGRYEPLYELNKGIAEFLRSNADVAKESLRHALQQLREPGSESNADPLCVLILDSAAKKVSFHMDLPVDAAILINLWRMGDSTREELESALAKLYPEKAHAWLATGRSQLDWNIQQP